MAVWLQYHGRPDLKDRGQATITAVVTQTARFETYRLLRLINNIHRIVQKIIKRNGLATRLNKCQ